MVRIRNLLRNLVNHLEWAALETDKQRIEILVLKN